ncbi:SH3 domain-containing protein [Devosia alba]|uniref:SH3 domain-containing protein n=1 Tax=Devosia alba TaxID=3152360 RepID=UPI002D16F692|nr:SH3 domain-containing protein [Devosia sp.]
MNRSTRKLLLNIATGVAVAATAVVVFLPAAYAAPGTVTTNVNVRSGPGTSYGVVDTARRGERVDVRQCQGSWCYIEKSGPDGWVSANYLATGSGGAVHPTQPGISFGFQIGGDGDGPTINFGIGNQPQRPIIRPVNDEVCFFDRTRFRGDSFCLEAGQSSRDLRGWADRISSIDNPDGLRVQVCSDANYRNCRTYTTSASSLGGFDNYIVSVRVR